MSSDDTLHDPPADDAPSGDLTGSGLIAEKSKRLLKLDQMRAAGGNPYPYRFDRTSTLAELRAQHGALDAGTGAAVAEAVALVPAGDLAAFLHSTFDADAGRVLITTSSPLFCASDDTPSAGSSFSM